MQFSIMAEHEIEEEKANRRWPTLMAVGLLITAAGGAIWYFNKNRSAAAAAAAVARPK